MMFNVAHESLSFRINLFSLSELARISDLVLLFAKLTIIHLCCFFLPFLAFTARRVVVAVGVTAGSRLISV